MKMAMKDGQILIREADNVQFTIIKSWGKMKWSRQTQTLSGPADIELLNRLAGLVNLPPSIEAERKKLNEVMAAVDRERMNPKPEPLIPPPVKVSPFTHQVRGYRRHSHRRWTSCTTTRAWQMSISGWSKNTRQKHQ